MSEQGFGEVGAVGMDFGKKMSQRRGHSVRRSRTTKMEDREGLPTPPPNPWIIQESSGRRVETEAEANEENGLGGTEEDEDIIAYLSGLSQQFPAECHNPDETFSHLDRLYNLTEQVLGLRERGSKLFKRVRQLERTRVLRVADLEAERAIAAGELPGSELPDEDAGFAESLLDAILANGGEPQTPRRSIKSPSGRRRSRSLGFPEQNLTPRVALNRPADPDKGRNNEGGPKVSKWTKVKAAFKWERACTNDLIEITETTPSTPTTKYLRIPEVTGSWSGSTLSPATSEVSGPSTSIGRISSASSSNEDVFDGQRKTISDKADDGNRRSNEGDQLPVVFKTETEEISNEVKNQLSLNTSPGKSSSKISSSFEQVIEAPDKPSGKRPTPILTITIPPNDEEFRNASSPESISPLPSSILDSGDSSPQRTKMHRDTISGEFKRQRSIAEEPAAPRPKMQRQDSKWNKVRRAFLTNAAFSVPPSPVRVTPRLSFQHDDSSVSKVRSCGGSVEDLGRNVGNSQGDTRRDYRQLREKLGAEFHQKLVEWEKLKSSGRPITAETLLPGEERLAPEFRRKLQEWKRAKKGRRGSSSVEQQQQQQSRASRRRLTDWQLWRSASKPEGTPTSGPRGSCVSVTSTGSAPSDARPHLCEDFVRRMEAWRRINSAVVHKVSSAIDDSEFLALDRLLSILAAPYGKNRPLPDRFAIHHHDTSERSQDSANEVLIRTSMGSYRFEGISREFTRKLYDWEKYRGISPRSSTFRLLGPTYAALAGESCTENCGTSANVIGDEEAMLGGLKRSKSMSSVQSNLRDLAMPRRSTSLQSLSRMADQLCDDNRASTSSAPIDVQRIEDATTEDSEPEAMIIDIEDVIEETASPLTRVQPHQMPVYSVAASETTSIAVPLGTVTSSHEPSPVILMEAEENHDPRPTERPETDISSHDEDSLRSNSSIGWNKFPLDTQYTRNSVETLIPVLLRTTIDDRDSSTANDGAKMEEDINRVKDLPSGCGSSKEGTERMDGRRESYPQSKMNNRKREEFKVDKVTVNLSSLGRPKQNQQENTSPYLQGITSTPQECITAKCAIVKSDVKLLDNDANKTRQKDEDPDVDFYERYRRSRENSVRSRWFQDFLSSTPNNYSNNNEIKSNNTTLQQPFAKEENSMKNQTKFPTSTKATSAFPFHGEPIVKTTALTVSTYPDSRGIKRIIINEKTLNKIVVPTSPELSRSIKSQTPVVEKDFETIGVEKGAEEEICRIDVDESSSIESRTKGISTGTTTNNRRLGRKSVSPNVFVKTKRMIFSPFRRTEESQRRRESIVLEPERGRSKGSSNESRSASPKISKQDAFHRLQLPLLWPLGISLKNQEVPEEIHKRSAQEGSNRKPSTSDENENPWRLASQESPEIHHEPKRVSLIASSVEKRKIPRVEKENSSVDSEKLSSDLMHKLRILSSVAARRDGRFLNETDFSIDTSGVTGIKRTKDTGFLSRRTICHSAVESRTSESVLSKVHREKSGEDGSGAGSSSGTSGTRPDLIKSASVGMINVEPDALGRVGRAMERGFESLPRTILKRRDTSGPLAKIVGKLGLARLIRARDSDESRMSAVSTLCRQSLFIGLPDFANCEEDSQNELREARNHSDDEIRKDTSRNQDDLGT
ncbi:uncharacterized protein [Prorops nasuta]|uniref:uncharacterized protein n=1 Tax=Prorops nasuta TaxID=863751 RepID=UPI0034CE859C